MRFRLQQRFAAPLDAVEAALVDPAFIERLAELPKLGRPELLRREQVGAIVHLDVRYAFAGELSMAVAKVVDPHKLTWVDSATFDRGAHTSDHRIVPEHYTGRLTAAYRTTLAPDSTGAGAGTVRTAEGDLEVHFPLVGGRVEKAILAGMGEHAELEARLVDQWIGATEG